LPEGSLPSQSLLLFQNSSLTITNRTPKTTAVTRTKTATYRESSAFDPLTRFSEVP